MRTKLRLLLCGLAATAAAHLAGSGTAEAKTFYWISHGSPADPVWTYFLAGAKQWAQGHRQHRQHLVPQRRRAVAAGGDARRHRRQGRRHRHDAAPIRAAWSRSSRRRRRPTSRSSTSTRPTRRPSFDAYVGGDYVAFGKHWAQYLVDKKLVKKGDFVWMPVEVPGATYGVQEEEGITSVLRAARHHLGGHRSDARPGRGHHPHGRLPHRQPAEGQGDHRPRRPGHRQRSSASSTRSASSRARSRWSAGATRSTPPRKC